MKELLGNELLHADETTLEVLHEPNRPSTSKYYMWVYPNGASASSLVYSVIQTAIANDLKPLSYLEYVFGQIQLTKDLQTEDLLPWSESFIQPVSLVYWG